MALTKRIAENTEVWRYDKHLIGFKSEAANIVGFNLFKVK